MLDKTKLSPNEGCPCGEYKDEDTEIHYHCWRTSYKDCGCPYAGVHYKGKRKKAEELAEMIREDYGCDVKVAEIKR